MNILNAGKIFLQHLEQFGNRHPGFFILYFQIIDYEKNQKPGYL